MSSTKPISTRTPPVQVEYDHKGVRVARLFEDAIEARRFYARMFKQQRNPRVRKVQ